MVSDSSDGSDGSVQHTLRLIGAILVAALIVAAYWLMFYDSGYQSGYNERKAKVESAHYAAYTADQIERECSGKVGSSARKCIAEIVKAERESQRGESDLAAQWEAAEWAKWAGVAALAQLIATVIGLYFIKGTLDATQTAVKDTGNATKAMIRQTELAEKAHAAEYRSWVLFDNLEVSHATELSVNGVPHGAGCTLQFQFTNFGRSPIINAKILAEISPTSKNDTQPPLFNASNLSLIHI